MIEIRINPDARNVRLPGPPPDGPISTCARCGGVVKLLNECSDTPRCGCGYIPEACTCEPTAT